jgi:tetratricopeptide (TPR) repeat protein
VLDFYRESLPSNHPYIAQTLHNIGSIYEYQGKLDDALGKYDESLNIKIKKLPQNHPSTNCTLKNIRSVKNRLNRNA